MRGPSVGLALLRALLRLLPRDARDPDARDVEALCRARREELGTTSLRGRFAFWVRELASVAWAVTLARWDGAQEQAGLAAFDLGITVRTLLRHPSFGLATVLVLGLGIGATAGVGSVGWSVLLAPLPYPGADRLVRLFHDDDLTFGVSLNELLRYREASRSLTALAGWSVTGATAGDGEQATRVAAARVTPDLLRVLGRRPALGRDFTQDGSEREVLVSHAFWNGFLGGDSAAVGTTLHLDDEPRRISGILPADVVFPEGSVEVWLPIDLAAASREGRGGTFLDVIARLAPGTEISAASEEVDVIARELRRHDPAAYEAEPGFGAHLAAFRDVHVGNDRPLLLALAGAAALLLLATCANVVLLLHARARRRAGEMAVRRALGAGAATLLRMHLAEAALLVVGGAAVGGAMAAATVEASVGALVPDARAVAGVPTAAEVGAAVAASGVVASLLLLVFLPRPGRTGAPPEGRGGAGPPARLLSLRHGLPAVQAALAMILVSASFILLQTVRDLTSTDLGYRVDGVLSARVTLPPARYPDPADQRLFFRTLESGWAAHPGVRRVGLVSSLPMSAYGGGGDVHVRSVDPDSALDVVTQRLVSPGYFSAVEIPLLAGRPFGPGDREGAPRVAIVDDAFARRWFGGAQAALGQQIRFFMGGDGWNEIVGVVGPVRHGGPAAGPAPHVYVPLEQRPTRSAHVVLRHDGDPSALAPSLRQRLARLDPGVPLYDIATMRDRLRGVMRTERTALAVFSTFGLLTLLLAAVGTCGLLALTQEARAPEIAIRRALGASGTAVARLVATDGLVGLAIGVTAGGIGALGMAVGLERLLATVEGEVSPALLAAAAMLFLSVTAGSVPPLLRALRVQPARAMKEERGG